MLKSIMITDQKQYLPFKPSFVSDWYYMESQSANFSKLVIGHHLNEMPIKVIADVKVKDGNSEYFFQGLGAAQIDDDTEKVYGGVVVLYDVNNVILMAPKDNNSKKQAGKITYTGNLKMEILHCISKDIDIRSVFSFKVNLIC